MPAFVKTEKDEKAWAKAKGIVSKQRKKPEAVFSDRDWALTNHIYHNIIESSARREGRRKHVRVLLAKVDYLLAARDKNSGLSDEAKTLVDALSAVMAKGGQTIAALRKAGSVSLSREEAEALANSLKETAAKVGDLLDKVSGD